MPLRPVSELGLVDLTDLTPPDRTEPAHVEQPDAEQNRPVPARRANRQKPRAPAPRRAAKSERTPTKPTTPGVRAKKTSSAARGGEGAPSQTPRSTTAARAKTTERAPARVMTPGVMKVGLPFLSGIAAVAGGLVVARAALQR